MKRYSTRTIIGKTQRLTMAAFSHPDVDKCFTRIRVAATRETMRLIEKAYAEGYEIGREQGYNDGFDCSKISDRGIPEVQKKIDEMDQNAPASFPDSLAAILSPGAGSLQDVICGNLTRKP